MSTSPNLKSNIKLRSGVSVTSITGKGLYKSFGEGEMRTTAVNDVSIDIKQGEVALMMGPSGSGKTTLLAILSGLLKPDAGKVTALGQDMWALTEREREHFRLKHCSFIFQGYNLFSSLTARQQLEIVAQWGDGASSREARKKADEILDILGLLKKAHLRPGELSGGEKQRVAIGRALIKQPKLLILDEPTQGLDDIHRTRLLDLLEKISAKNICTIRFVSHRRDEHRPFFVQQIELDSFPA